VLQQLGDCLGKGAFGSVYRALNWNTGETVAVKQIKLTDLPKSELRVIMVCHALIWSVYGRLRLMIKQLEIDLLKNLDVRHTVNELGELGLICCRSIPTSSSTMDSSNRQKP
jgi:serine/threonine protein kinase